MRNLISGCSAGRGSRTSARGHGQSQTNRFLPASAPDVRMGRQQQPPCAPGLLPFLPGAWSWGGRSEGELGGAHRVPTVLLPQQGTPLQSPCSPGRSTQGVNVMGERKAASIARSYMAPCPNQSPSHAGPAAPAGPGCGAQHPGAFPAPNLCSQSTEGHGQQHGHSPGMYSRVISGSCQA